MIKRPSADATTSVEADEICPETRLLPLTLEVGDASVEVDGSRRNCMRVDGSEWE